MWDDQSCEVSDVLGEYISLSSEAFLLTFCSFFPAHHTEAEDEA